MVIISMEGAYFKGFIMAGLGLMFSFIGVDVVTGYPRNVFGQVYLMDGIGFSLFLIGMYAIGRLVAELPHGGAVAETARLSGGLMGGMLEGIKISFIRWKVSVRAGIIGVLVGALPGTGVSVSAALSYMDARNHTKDPEPPSGPETTTASWHPSALTIPPRAAGSSPPSPWEFRGQPPAPSFLVASSCTGSDPARNSLPSMGRSSGLSSSG